jgi:heterodisulfide reductase subunit A-like polyferredoxin
MLFGAVTQQAWCFQALQQIACEKCGLTVCPENRVDFASFPAMLLQAGIPESMLFIPAE